MLGTHTRSCPARHIRRSVRSPNISGSVFGMLAMFGARAARLFGRQRVFSGFLNNFMQPQVIYYTHFYVELLHGATSGRRDLHSNPVHTANAQWANSTHTHERAQKTKIYFLDLEQVSGDIVAEYDIKEIRCHLVRPFRLSFDTLPPAIWFAIFHNEISYWILDRCVESENERKMRVATCVALRTTRTMAIGRRTFAAKCFALIVHRVGKNRAR